jgi:integrase
MAGTTDGRRRPRGAGSIQWRRGRPYAVYRDALTGKQTWVGFDSEEQADAFLAQWAADRKAARVAVKAARVEREARAPQRRPASSSDPWTFGQLLSDWEERHRDGVQESTMREYGPGLRDLRRALGGVLARSLSDEHFEAYKRAKLDGIDVGGGSDPVRKLSAATVNKRLDLARRVIAEAIRRGVIDGPNPVEQVVRPRDPKREQMVLTESELRRLIDAADTLELRALMRCFCELALRFSEATGLPIAAYDPEQRTVRIRQQAAEQREPKPLRMIIKDYTKTPWGVRTLRVSRELAEELDAIIARRGDRPNPYGLFFTDTRGGILREPNFIRDRWRPLLRRAGFVESIPGGKRRPRRGLTPHVARHSRASLIAARHSELFAPKLQRFLGHHSVTFTLAKYGSHFSKGMLEPAEYLTDLEVADLGDPEPGAAGSI